jgi:acetyl-CoA carboxylase biotin carboxyl carrier protein
MNIEEITRIAELMTAHDLAEFVIESPEVKLSLKRSRGGADGSVGTAPAVYVAPTVPAVAAPPAAPAPAAPAVKAITIDSPIVGTFYAASAPDAAPFVKAGDRVTEETVVCIVEAMKVMNEIKAEKAGVIQKVLVENGKPVEYGQPLFELEPA